MLDVCNPAILNVLLPAVQVTEFNAKSSEIEAKGTYLLPGKIKSQ